MYYIDFRRKRDHNALKLQISSPISYDKTLTQDNSTWTIQQKILVTVVNIIATSNDYKFRETSLPATHIPIIPLECFNWNFQDTEDETSKSSDSSDVAK